MATTSKPRSRPGFLSTRRGRILIENLTAYTFLAPAGIVIFLFGIFPVAFSLYVSLHRWRRFPENYVALDNYERALGGFGYVFFFWLSLAGLLYGLYALYQLWRQSSDNRRELALSLPGIVNGVALLVFVRWFFTLLPVVLNIPQRVRGQERVPGLFVNELFASFQYPEVVEAGNLLLGFALVAVVLSLLVVRWVRSDDSGTGLLGVTGGALVGGAGLLGLQLVVSQINEAVAAAQAAGEPLALWSQVLLISLGAALVLLAYVVWTRAVKTGGDRAFVLKAVAAVALLAAGYFLVTELPRTLVTADDDMLQAYGVTLLFVIGTVPVQLASGLGLAYLLFQNIRGKSFFRIIYFLPYITPFVATSIVFRILFSHRPTSLANIILSSLGMPAQNWLLEPRGIFQLMFGSDVPAALAGPSLALIVIMIYSVWTYIGYDTVIFLAGLGNIPGELYEAARIDGASGWGLFRHITLPLLSPTTFFLSLIAIIGTFQAFTQIWIMRTPSSAKSVDTVSVYIFEAVRSTDPNMGYGSAMAFVLFVIILLMTFAQNRIAESRVFYG
jgi:multiple sugar transport system permease protein